MNITAAQLAVAYHWPRDMAPIPAFENAVRRAMVKGVEKPKKYVAASWNNPHAKARTGNISAIEAHVLTLASNPAGVIRNRALAAAVGVGRSSINSFCAGLITARLVETEKEGRIIKMHITEDGKKALAKWKAT